MRISFSLLLVAALLAGVAAAPAPARAAYAIPSGHPRIFFTSADIPSIANRCRTGGTHRQHYEKLLAFSDAGINANRTDALFLPNYALVYVIHEHWNQTGYSGGGFEVNKYGNFVRNALLSSSSNWGIDSKAAARAFAADWIWDRLSTADISTIAPKYGAPQTSIPDGHTWRDACTWDRLTQMSRSLLYAGSNADNGNYATEYQKVCWNIENVMTKAFDLHGGAAAIGPSYETGHQFCRAWFIEAFTVATGVDGWTLSGKWPLEWGKWIALSTPPHRGTMAMKEDSRPQYGDDYRNVALMAARANDPYHQAHNVKQWNDIVSRSAGDYRNACIWCFVLWYDPTLPPYNPATAPKAVRLGEGGTDQIYMCTGRDANATWANFGAGMYLYGHQHQDEGSFIIHRKGNLIIDSGYYAHYWSTDGGSHASNYFHRSIAHNTVHVYNPNEIFYWTAGGAVVLNEGGQVMPSSAPTYAQATTDPTFRPGKILRYETNDAYTYALADLATAYDQEAISASRNKPFQPNKLTHITREFIFLRPDFFVVFDRVGSVNPNFTKVWNVHFQAEPTIQGSGVQRRGNAEAGIWDYAGASIARVTDPSPSYGQGSLFLKSLLPKNRTMRKIGGNNRSHDGYAYWAGGIDANGKYDPTKGANYYWGEWSPGSEGEEAKVVNHTIGWGRIEVEATTPALEDLFLHVLYPCDASVQSMPDTRLIETGNMVGAEIVNDRVILFGRAEGVDIDSVTYSLAPGDTASLQTICNLASSAVYRVFRAGRTLYLRRLGMPAPGGAEEILTPPPTSTPAGILSFTFSGENALVQIGNVAASIIGGQTFAVAIEWETNIPSDSRVEYGPTPALGFFTPLDPALVTSHSVVLTEPAAENDVRTYFRVHSVGAGGQYGVSETHSFLFDVVPPAKVTDLRAAE